MKNIDAIIKNKLIGLNEIEEVYFDDVSIIQSEVITNLNNVLNHSRVVDYQGNLINRYLLDFMGTTKENEAIKLINILDIDLNLRERTNTDYINNCKEILQGLYHELTK